MSRANELLVESLENLSDQYIARGQELLDVRRARRIAEERNTQAAGAVLEAKAVLRAIEIAYGAGPLNAHLGLVRRALNAADENLTSTSGLLDNDGRDLIHAFDDEPITQPMEPAPLAVRGQDMLARVWNVGGGQ